MPPDISSAPNTGSSLLWLLFLLLLWRLPLDLVVGAKLLGLLMGCLALWLVHKLCRFHIRDPVLRLAPPLLTAASTPFLMWSQRGLETPLFAVIVLWLALCCSSPRQFRWWPVPAVLLLPARPEGFFFLLALLPAAVLHRKEWRAIGRGVLLVALAAVVLLAGRFAYFHDLVPHAFYLRFAPPGGRGLLQIPGYLRDSHGYLLALPLLLVAWRRSFWTSALVVLLGFVLTIAAWRAIAGDPLPYRRALVPAIPLIYMIFVTAVDIVAHRGRSRRRRALAIGYVAAVFVATLAFSKSPSWTSPLPVNPLRGYIGAFAADPWMGVQETAAKFASPLRSGSLDVALGRADTLGTNYQALVGQFLRRNYHPNALVVYDQMGQTPYYAGPSMRFVDSFGLTDRTIAAAYFQSRKRDSPLLRIYGAVVSRAVAAILDEQRPDVTADKALDYLFGLEPDLILINAVVEDTHPHGIVAQLGREPRLNDRYELRYTAAAVVRVYEKKGTPRKLAVDVPEGLVVARH